MKGPFPIFLYAHKQVQQDMLTQTSSGDAQICEASIRIKSGNNCKNSGLVYWKWQLIPKKDKGKKRYIESDKSNKLGAEQLCFYPVGTVRLKAQTVHQIKLVTCIYGNDPHYASSWISSSAALLKLFQIHSVCNTDSIDFLVYLLRYYKVKVCWII